MRNTLARGYGVVIVALALAAVFPTPARSRVQLGFELGANVSTLRYEHLAPYPPTLYWDPGWRTSLTAGVSLELPLRRRVSVLTGLRYVQMGNRVQVRDPMPPPLTAEFRIAQHYLAVPVLLAARPFPSQRIFLAGGPEGALLISGRSFVDYTSPALGSTSSSITQDLRRTNLSLNAQAGVEFPAGKHLGMATLRQSYGLVEVQKKDHWGVAWRTRGVEGLVGIRW